jgi:hypothetical protein
MNWCSSRLEVSRSTSLSTQYSALAKVMVDEPHHRALLVSESDSARTEHARSGGRRR